MYKIGITVYDEDTMLFETKVGNEKLDLLYSVWGETEGESLINAQILVTNLTK